MKVGQTRPFMLKSPYLSWELNTHTCLGVQVQYLARIAAGSARGSITFSCTSVFAADFGAVDESASHWPWDYQNT